MTYIPGTLGLREDLWHTTLTIPAGALGVGAGAVTFEIDNLTGGSAKAKDSKYRPANGTERQLSLGGPKEIDNITMKALFNNQTMDLRALIGAAGKVSVTVARTPLNEAGEVQPNLTVTYEGKLIEVVPPPINSESETAAVVEFIVSPVSQLAA